MLVPIKTKRYFSCPAGCSHEFSIEHLFDGAKDKDPQGDWAWYCDDCGQQWKFRIQGDRVEVEAQRSRYDPCWVILELQPQELPVRFKLRANRYTDKDGERSTDEEIRYLYEEHSCPIKWAGSLQEVSIGADDDPHGLFRVVGIYDHDTLSSDEVPLLSADPPASAATLQKSG